jgi:hypothetical protein
MVDANQDEKPEGGSIADVFYFREWLAVLSSPRILQAMRRKPTKEHLLRMLDAFLPYTRTTRQRARLDSWEPDPQKREARALELRAAIERWDSPEISREIIQAARALSREDGDDCTDETWDAHEVPLEFPPEDYLLWPEGVPLQLREEGKG